MDAPKLKYFSHKLYHMSVSLFIVGIIFAANGWEGSSEMIIIGGTPLAMIFFFRAFGSPESNWLHLAVLLLLVSSTNSPQSFWLVYRSGGSDFCSLPVFKLGVVDGRGTSLWRVTVYFVCTLGVWLSLFLLLSFLFKNRFLITTRSQQEGKLREPKG